ncbi:hypothetical protein ES705_38647 [subsurface metagenome]
MSPQPKVVSSYRTNCPNRYAISNECTTTEPNAAVVLVYEDGKVEVKCPYCGIVKSLSGPVETEP